ncbi:predicted protein [Lichtheimia corymbifera JMRC:FSU:9682]|uniref:Uncharacterized protein n=1 Tax=Lichtheimia corymbifera JMRC:FSU:9682 TaxID=1263082 RepID=A0A068SH33_9FUNG|nr:predicted protein [Lichtheimia corymbifera JMRC:FSU:9682]
MSSSRQYTNDEIDTANALNDLSSRFTRQASMNTGDNNRADNETMDYQNKGNGNGITANSNEDESMPDQLRKSRKRGSYQKIESQTMLAAATNVVRRGYHVEQAATAAQIKPATLRSAVRRYRLRGTVVPKKRSRKANGEFNTDVVRFICDWVDEHEHTVPLYTTLWMQWMLMHFLKN